MLCVSDSQLMLIHREISGMNSWGHTTCFISTNDLSLIYDSSWWSLRGRLGSGLLFELAPWSSSLFQVIIIPRTVDILMIIIPLLSICQRLPLALLVALRVALIFSGLVLAFFFFFFS